MEDDPILTPPRAPAIRRCRGVRLLSWGLALFGAVVLGTLGWMLAHAWLHQRAALIPVLLVTPPLLWLATACFWQARWESAEFAADDRMLTVGSVEVRWERIQAIVPVPSWHRLIDDPDRFLFLQVQGRPRPLAVRFHPIDPDRFRAYLDYRLDALWRRLSTLPEATALVPSSGFSACVFESKGLNLMGLGPAQQVQLPYSQISRVFFEFGGARPGLYLMNSQGRTVLFPRHPEIFRRLAAARFDMRQERRVSDVLRVKADEGSSLRVASLASKGVLFGFLVAAACASQVTPTTWVLAPPSMALVAGLVVGSLAAFGLGLSWWTVLIFRSLRHTWGTPPG